VPALRSRLTDGGRLAARIRGGDLSAAPAVLNLLEGPGEAERAQARELLAAVSPSALGGEAPGHLIGPTGPPGVGKSTLLGALVQTWRASGTTVAVLAVDPSSRQTGGALLGDRLRIAHAAGDRGVFIRSMAAGERLGGLAPATRAAAAVLAVAFDRVVIETVGVGQSETEIGDVADTVVVVVQPGAGDSLQFLKSGLMEIPDLVVVAKADLGAIAQATLREARSALRSFGPSNGEAIAVTAIPPASGIDELVAALDMHHDALDLHTRRLQTRRRGAVADFVSEYGERALRAVGGRRGAETILVAQNPELDAAALVETLVVHAAAKGIQSVAL
jgi:LAO/AO transport system kinase